MDPEDAAAGWHQRIVHLNEVKKPEVHQVIVTGGGKREVTNLPSIVCDGCGAPLFDGAPAVAITMWRGDEPPMWEQEFGNL